MSPVDTARCRQCGGTGEAHPAGSHCLKCYGSGKQTCPNSCHGFARCHYCNDTGRTDQPCRACGGEGFTEPSVPCPAAHVVLHVDSQVIADGVTVYCDPDKLTPWCEKHNQRASMTGDEGTRRCLYYGSAQCRLAWAVVTVYQEQGLTTSKGRG